MAENDEIPLMIENEDGTKKVMGSVQARFAEIGVEVSATLADGLAKRLGLTEDLGSFSIAEEND